MLSDTKYYEPEMCPQYTDGPTVGPLFTHENLTTGIKILWKREEIATKERSNFFSFPQYFLYISNFSLC